MTVLLRSLTFFFLLATGLLSSRLEARDAPPPGEYVPGELRLGGLSRVAADTPVRIAVWAIRPQLPYFYSGIKSPVAPRADLKLEVRDGSGQWVGGGEPRFQHGQWQMMDVIPEGLKPGRYEVVLTMLYDDLAFNRISKRLTVLTPESLAATPRISAEKIADMGSLRTETQADGSLVAMLPADRELILPLPGEARMAVYGTFVGPLSDFLVSLAGQDRELSASGADYLSAEFFLGFATGGKDALRLESGKQDLRIKGLRMEPLTGASAKLAAHNEPTIQDRAVVMNNDGYSEGFFDAEWKIQDLPLQVLRYKDTDVTQLDWCSLVSNVASYRSKYADFYGEGFNGKWARTGEKAAYENYRAIAQHEPPLFPWLVATGKQIGLPIWGSLRMSNSYGNHPFGEVLNGRLWFERAELRIRRTPEEAVDNDNPLSFAYEEVQAMRIGVIRELAEMGCAGVNLDYCRYPLIMGYDVPLLERFEKVHGEDGRPFALDDPRWVKIRKEVHNDFLRKVRGALDQVGKAQGRRVSLSIRLPATKFESFSFDPKTWIKEGLVDALIPGFPGHDRWVDVGFWRKMIGSAKIDLWPNIEYYRFSKTSELTDEQIAQGMRHAYKFVNAREDYLRRAAEAYAAGADGMYIFNRWLEPGLFRGLSDATFIRNWQEFQNPDNLDSEVAMKSRKHKTQ
jgi:hypothetical protein